MKFKQLGYSGLLVSDICLGTMIFGEDGPRGTAQPEAERMIHRYLEAGGNHVDTADVYAGGRSEEIVGQALKARRSDVILATKVHFPKGDGPNDQGLSRHHIIEGIHGSLRRLDTDYIDLYYMHCWDPLTPIEESLRAFDDLIRDGKVRYIGVSNFKAWQVMKAVDVSSVNGFARPVAGQYQYSLVKRDIEYEYIDLFEGEGVALMPWGPLGGGFLTGKYKRGERPTEPDQGRIATTAADTEEAWNRRNSAQNWDIMDAVGSIAEARGASYSQIALAWARMQRAVSSVIIGVRTMAQLEDNLQAADIQLTAEELASLDQASQLPELYPYRLLSNYARA
ncbi:MAG: aldo/keto reductase [Anaerolineae bacterium]|nr:aldo/keto reductase [Anaerolineae bacterium]